MASSAPASTHAKCTICSSSLLWTGTCCIQLEMFCLWWPWPFQGCQSMPESKSSKRSSATHHIHDSDDSATESSSSEESESTTSVEELTKSVARLEANGKIKACKYVGHCHSQGVSGQSVS